MQKFYYSILFGLVVSGANLFLIKQELTLWDVNLVSLTGLIAGIFFILAMIFRSGLQDYKRADIALSTVRSKILSLNDMNYRQLTQAVS